MKETATQGIREGFARRQRSHWTAALIFAAAVASLAVILLMVGNTNYSLGTVIQVLIGEKVKGATFAVKTLRLPRMLAGLLSGMAFGMAGSTFQTILRNPLASPDIIGITSGSSAAAVFCLLVLNISGPAVSVAAVICGLAVSGIIYLLSGGGAFSGGRLILIGLGIQAMLRAAVNFMLIKANQYDIPAAMRWLAGSLNTIGMSEIPLLFAAVIIFGSAILLLGEHLALLELGEEAATSLGVRASRVRLLLTGSAVVLIAFASAVTGPIAFVAFLSGPIARKFSGSGSSHTLLSGLTGALIVLCADYTGQFVLGIKLPAGIITGILGAPYLIILLINLNRSGGAA